ncbi:hypothetical protein PAHAL_3G063200 [Panicum hallii]|uniref:WW domain-containing protein n=1 Tax=Panicum hallii TaxID=206008 RepID=A0A2S3H6K8_9POAL|nr:uncharacterized protein LOC112884188 [Panicum hallii]PAN16473.1 hypothetical protein PAHAL_3G063200 [Panicum hallii]
MTTEFLRVKKFHHQQETESPLSLRKRMELQPELSLAPAWPAFAPAPAARSSSSESDGTSRKKRKHHAAGTGWEEPQQPPASLELQLNDPLPLDWEQCLDLQSGRMYYLNRKTLRKSWVRPREQSVNLDLNISAAAIVDTGAGVIAAPDEDAERTRRPAAGAVSSGGNNMVAVPCANCHLLVMLCKSSPSCPNCKFVQPLAPATPRAAPARPAHRRLDAAIKPLETLSLLH